jgi:molybdate transport system substrate-binding protein
MRSRVIGAVAAVAGCAVAGVSCAGATSSSDATVTVFAAASLTEAFGELGDAFDAANPDTELVVSFASSSDLARQIIEGAPADVFVSADLDNMAKVTDADAAIGRPVVFATNRAEIIVEPGNPLEIVEVADLADPDLVLVVCAPEVPCGSYAEQVVSNAGVTVIPDSLEENVKAVVAKVTLGEADAGIVYATDVLAAGDEATGVEIPDDVNVVADYPIVAVSDDAESAAFVDFVLGPAGQTILARHGFGAPHGFGAS